MIYGTETGYCLCKRLILDYSDTSLTHRDAFILMFLLYIKKSFNDLHLKEMSTKGLFKFVPYVLIHKKTGRIYDKK